MKALKYIRIVLAAVMLTGITALLLDTIGLLRHWLGWMPKVQLLPAVLALNVAVVAVILVVTLLVGRLYCSVVCPLGIFQDIVTWFHKIIFGKKRPYRYRKPQNWLRYTVLAVFVVLMVAGLGSIAALVAPYSAYARMVTHLHGSGLAQGVAIATLCCVGVMSFIWGRLWCNTLCPVGSLLGLISRYRILGIRIDANKCGGCRKCEKACKAMCIDVDSKTVDHSRCVDCFNCLGECNAKAIKFSLKDFKDPKDPKDLKDPSRRRFVAGSVAVGVAMAAQAQEQKMDGGLAALAHKSVPDRQTPLKPAGAKSLKHFSAHCTSCQLCVSQCPEHVLRPSTGLMTLLQPEISYAEGYCRTACTRCGEVCPTGAILPLTKEEKTAVSIGVAVVLKDNCIGCGACARHCPAEAIVMVDGRPAVNESRCLGCGACEYYCPARPVTAIYVEGKQIHTEI